MEYSDICTTYIHTHIIVAFLFNSLVLFLSRTPFFLWSFLFLFFLYSSVLSFIKWLHINSFVFVSGLFSEDFFILAYWVLCPTSFLIPTALFTYGFCVVLCYFSPYTSSIKESVSPHSSSVKTVFAHRKNEGMIFISTSVPFLWWSFCRSTVGMQLGVPNPSPFLLL